MKISKLIKFYFFPSGLVVARFFLTFNAPSFVY